MAAFSATDAAFEGFRLAREKPVAILMWGVLLLVFSVVSGGALVALAGPALADMMEASRTTPQTDPTAMMAQMGAIAPAYLSLMILSLGLYAVLYAAVYRAVLRPGDAALGYLRFGPEELWQALALLLVFVLLFGAYIGVALVAGLGVGIAVAGGGGIVGGVLGVVAVIGALGVLVWLAVKLSLVAPMAFERRTVDLAAAWRLTRGRFWGLLGAYLLATVLMIVVYLLALVIFVAIAAVLTGGITGVGAVFSPDMRSLGAYFTPLMLVYTVFVSFLGAFALAITVGATGAAYRQLAPSQGADVFA